MNRPILLAFAGAFIQISAFAGSDVRSEAMIDRDAVASSQPVILEVRRPSYPDSLLRHGVDGQVLVRAVVSDRGEVVAAETISATSPQFARAAEKAVESWYFEPARIDGVGVYRSVYIPIRFRVSDHKALVGPPATISSQVCRPDFS